ncbi:MAG: glycosyltransferase [Lachnospiraceae bacterium]|nr:glycosyltransferase [Lachnospiraceae bacterium]
MSYEKGKNSYCVFDFKSSAENNYDIANCDAEWIFFGKSDWVDDHALQNTLTKLDMEEYAGCIFSGDANHSVTDGVSVLSFFRENIAGFVFRKSALVRTGKFNEFIGDGADLEFLCRLADVVRVCWLPEREIYSGETGLNREKERSDSRELCETLAYLSCRYRNSEQMETGFDEILTIIVNDLKNRGMLQDYMDLLQKFTQNAEIYRRVIRNTAPIYIITGDDTAYGVLKDFAVQLAEAFVRQGQAVITTDGRHVPYSGVEDIEGRPLKALVGFQAPALFNDYFKGYEAPKCQFWFDDPVFFDDVFQQIEGDDRYFILCQDGYHAQHLREHYHIRNAVHFPPGGCAEAPKNVTDRDLDLVFIGTYSDPKDYYSGEEEREGFAGAYIDYMLEHPDRSYEQGVRELLAAKGIDNLSQDEYMHLLWSLANEYRYIRACFRKKVIEEIAGSGLKLHVYGESWKRYAGKGKENLILHSSLDPEGVKKVLNRAKISLNIMSWHKDGWTERVIESMLSGCVCVTDQTRCMIDKFGSQSRLDDAKEKLDGELTAAGIVRFELEEAAHLPKVIERLLEDDSLREAVARNGYEYASKNETWDVRARDMLKMLEE